MTGAEKAIMAIMAGQGLLSGLSSRQASGQNQQMADRSRMDDIMRMMMQFEQGRMDRGQAQATDFADRSPLGAEQRFVQRNKILGQTLPNLAGMGPMGTGDPNIRGAMGGMQNVLSGLDLGSTFSDEATARSLTERRKALAGIDPSFNFGSLTNYGIGDPFANEVGAARSAAQGRQDSAYERIQNQLAGMASGASNQLGQPQQEKKKGGGFLGGLGNVLKMAAPFAGFIPGVGPLAAIGIGAAAGGLGGKLSGSNPVTSAIMGGGGAYGVGGMRSGNWNPLANTKGGGGNLMFGPSADLAGELASGGFEGNLAGLGVLPGFAEPGGSVTAPPGFIEPPQGGMSRTMPVRHNAPSGPAIAPGSMFGPPSSAMGPMSTRAASPPQSRPNRVGDDIWSGAQSIGPQPQPGFMDYLLNPGEHVIGPAIDSIKDQPLIRSLMTPQGMLMGGAIGSMPRAVGQTAATARNPQVIVKAAMEKLNDPSLNIPAKQAILQALQKYLRQIPSTGGR